MKFFKRLRRKPSKSPHAGSSSSPSNSNDRIARKQQAYSHHDDPVTATPLPIPRHDLTKELPDNVLTRIFTFVCPHAVDNSYENSEESMTENGCMLCDMRDLAYCALVCKRWYYAARALL